MSGAAAMGEEPRHRHRGMRPGAAVEGDADGNSVRTLANEIARRIIIANPYFGAAAAGGGTPYPQGVAPDDLGIVATHAAAGVRAVFIVSGFRGPIVHNLRWSGPGAGNLKQILSVGRLAAMEELLVRRQIAGPLLREDGEAFGPDERWNVHAPANCVVTGRGPSAGNLKQILTVGRVAAMEKLLLRPVGRPSIRPLVEYKSFLYQAASWKKARRVVAKVEHRQGELFPRVGFIVTNLNLPSRAVVRFYNKCGTAENWAETHQSCGLAPDWKAYGPLLMGTGYCWYSFRRRAAKTRRNRGDLPYAVENAEAKNGNPR